MLKGCPACYEGRCYDDACVKTDLEEAIQSGKWGETARLVRDGALLGEYDSTHKTPVIEIAVSNGHVELFLICVQFGSGPRVSNEELCMDRNGERIFTVERPTLLHHAVYWKLARSAFMVKYVLDSWPDLARLTPGGEPMTPLHVAVVAQDLDAMSALLDAGVPVDGYDGFDPPLSCALNKEGEEVGRYLISKGADIHRAVRSMGICPPPRWAKDFLKK